MPTQVTIEDENATTAEAQDWSEEPAAEEGTEAKKTKKLISLRLPQEDLAHAKALAEELKLGYQTLLNQVIHDGLAQREAQLKVEKLTETLKTSVPALSAAQELANSPA